MNSNGKVEDTVLLDKQTTDPLQKKIQKSIEKTIKNKNYEWQTVRVDNDGKIEME
jgi:hypothetical protein